MPTTLDRSSDARLAHAKRDTLALLETILGPPRDWSIAFRLWDGTSAGPADAPTTLVLVHPWSMRSLLWPPNEVNAGEEHYARTLRHWVANLEREHDRVVKATDEVTYRIWRLYMSGSAHNFDVGRLGVFQTLLFKPCGGPACLPPTRADWYAAQPGAASAAD